jgi:hypothetical protein
MRARVLFPAAALLAACEHGAPLRPGDYSPDGPFAPTPPVRLTWNPGIDVSPAWLPGGDDILYAAERLDRVDDDQCLAVLPAGGGGIRRYLCRTTAPDDSVNVFAEAALAPDGRMAYVRTASHRLPGRPISPDVQSLVLATVTNPNAARVLRAIAYTAPSGRVHQGVSHIGWLDSTRLVYLGEAVTYPRPCSSCAPDTVRTGIEIVTLDFAAPTPVLAVVSGTDGASSVSVGTTGDTIYYTRNGESRVYRYAFSSGQTDTVHDFGAGIARDVSLADGRLVAVVGGAVTYTVDSVLGAAQVDSGGELHAVTLATGAETLVGDPAARYRRPSFSSTSTRVVVESWISGRADLWLVDVP